MPPGNSRAWKFARNESKGIRNCDTQRKSWGGGARGLHRLSAPLNPERLRCKRKRTSLWMALSRGLARPHVGELSADALIVLRFPGKRPLAAALPPLRPEPILTFFLTSLAARSQTAQKASKTPQEASKRPPEGSKWRKHVCFHLHLNMFGVLAFSASRRSKAA